ncbi:MAG: iron-sulfur cluster-binding protein [Acidobacteria bacterium RIFCSPLOWO2_02_FULL_68_18]|nr:MAG: iron-sulfur cluster-binding protein [Acidobacteria bacterium RIFCSPLOWO2_02_FULL_68_18]OFW50060.1 MAG: iron-sulfur cluster-binding protein [Acidobacteria bacterium RIFCSPLOWO2_12_FULL_68_19]
MPVVIDAPATPEPRSRSRAARVAVIRTRPETVIEDYARVMDLAGYRDVLARDRDTLLKLNLSWTKYFPACSSQPWQVDGVVSKMLRDGFTRERLLPVENRTVVTDPRKGCRNNRWEPVLERHGLTFTPLTDVEWQVYRFKSPLLKLNEIFPEGIQIPTLYPGRQILHLPTVKTHGHAVMTGAVKNSFGGLLREVRHYAHKYMHEVLVDLLYMQRELHPAVFTVMDGTVAGDGAGPRTMVPRVKGLILAAVDSVAIDAVASRLMGFDPLSIPFLRMAHERGLGIADPKEIEVVGDDVSQENFGFQTRRSLVIWGDQMIRKGFLRPLEQLLLHSPLMVWAPFASNVYHDALWYPTIGRSRIRSFMRTEWGQLFRKY